jgi:FtsZ-interacting cell division protein ZipA
MIILIIVAILAVLMIVGVISSEWEKASVKAYHKRKRYNRQRDEYYRAKGRK